MSLPEAITYTWVAQALFVLLPWTGDPEVALAVRSGSVAYDRLRPLDAYALWYARAAGWLVARALPRAALMLVFAAFVLPLLDLSAWAWRPPATLAAGLLFSVSQMLAVMLSSAVLMLIGVAVLAGLNERGINVLMTPLVLVFSGNLLPLALFPDTVQTLLRWQPLAGLLDIPLRIYFGHLHDAAALEGLCVQAFWIFALVVLGRMLMARALPGLEVQGG